ncbi:MAG: AI-2E family transporter [Candidatus Cloacimonadota bacterium]|nr:AI-2E family transporter [Candidatus Cloacimonadota bacterium]
MERIRIFRWIVIFLALVVAVIGIWFYHFILNYVIISFIFAYLLFPIINFASKHGIPRSLTILIMYVLILGLIIIVVNVLIPQTKRQAEETSQLVEVVQKKLIENEKQDGRMDIQTTLESVGLGNVAVFIEDLQKRFAFIEIDKFLKKLFDQLITLIGRIPKFLLDSISGVISILAFIVVIPFISFFMINDERKLMKTFFSWIPNRFFEFSLYLFEQIEDSFGRFFRALLLETVIIFLLTFIGLLILKMPYALTLALIVGLTNPIKFFGPFIGFIPIILVILIGPTPDIFLLYTTILIILIQQFDSNVLFPSLVGKGLGMHPLWVLLTVIAGGYAFGIAGLVFAVPVVFLVKTIIVVSANSLKQFEII